MRALQVAATEVRQCAAEVGGDGVARRNRRVFTAEGADAHADPVRSAASASRMLRAALAHQQSASAAAPQPLLQLLGELPQRVREAEIVAGLGACCAGDVTRGVAGDGALPGEERPSQVRALLQWMDTAIATLVPLTRT